jgi:putative ABC transport system permease protein
MRLVRILRDRLRALFGRDVVSGEIHEEIQFHLDARIAEHERRGLSPEAARQAAFRRFGNPAVVADQGYDVRGGGLMESVIQDVKYGARLLLRQRGFSVVALTTLALGIGATTAIFCVVDAALIRPLPYDKPEQLVQVSLRRADRPDVLISPSIDDMKQWRALTHVFSFMGSARGESVVVLEGAEPEHVSVSLITHEYLPLYGRSLRLGRGFTADDEQLGAPPVAILGYRYWQTTFQGDPSVVGRAIRFSNDSAMIVGVVSDDESRAQAKIYRPMQLTAERSAARQQPIYARLRDGVSMAQAQREIDGLAARLEKDTAVNKGMGARITSQYELATKYYRTTVNILLGAVGFVLLIACVNVASLQLARGATRETELAIRASIGAGRGRLIRQLLTESMVLSVAGSALGALLAWLVLDTLVANIPIRISPDVSVGLNPRVLGATIALATICGALFGLTPALRLSRTEGGAMLGRDSRGVRTTLSKASGGLLVAIEVAAAIVLVTGAMLMVRSFMRMNELPLGFDSSRFITAEVTPVDNRPDAYGQFYADFLARIRQLPGVTSAGGTNALPLDGTLRFGNVRTGPSEKTHGVVIQGVTPGYFETLGVPLRGGRFPTGPDVSDPAWIVLSERCAALIFPEGSAIGQQVKSGDLWREVIGVVGNVYGPIDSPHVYIGYSPTGWNLSLTGQVRAQAMTIVVDPADSGKSLPAAVRAAAKLAGPPVIVRRIRQGSEWWSDHVTTPRQRTVMLGILGGLGLLLSLVGVFGVTSFAVARRVPEIGVRLAFGARPAEVVRTMVKDTAVPIFIGITIGLAGAFFLTKVIVTFLYQTAPRDPAAFVTAALLLVACSLIAAWIPARRAAKVDPAIALRSE